MNKLIAASVVTIIAYAPTVMRANGQQNQEEARIYEMAIGLDAYERSKSQCYYEDVVGVVMGEVDQYGSQSVGDENWGDIKSRMQSKVGSIGNRAKLLNLTSACKAYDMPVGTALAYAYTLIDADKALPAAFDRLMRGGGQTNEEHAVGAPPIVKGPMYVGPNALPPPPDSYMAKNPHMNDPQMPSKPPKKTRKKEEDLPTSLGRF